MGDAAGEPADRLHLLRLPQLGFDPRDVGDVVERHRDSVVVQAEGLDREDARPDPVVGILDLAGVEHLARLDDLQQAVDQRRPERSGRSPRSGRPMTSAIGSPVASSVALFANRSRSDRSPAANT